MLPHDGAPSEKSRRERAIEQAYDRDDANRDAPDPLSWVELLLECYEIELLADIEAEGVNVETMVGRALYELTAGGFRHSNVTATEVRDALKAAFREESR